MGIVPSSLAAGAAGAGAAATFQQVGDSARVMLNTSTEGIAALTSAGNRIITTADGELRSVGNLTGKLLQDINGQVMVLSSDASSLIRAVDRQVVARGADVGRAIRDLTQVGRILGYNANRQLLLLSKDARGVIKSTGQLVRTATGSLQVVTRSAQGTLLEVSHLVTDARGIMRLVAADTSQLLQAYTDLGRSVDTNITLITQQALLSMHEIQQFIHNAQGLPLAAHNLLGTVEETVQRLRMGGHMVMWFAMQALGAIAIFYIMSTWWGFCSVVFAPLLGFRLSFAINAGVSTTLVGGYTYLMLLINAGPMPLTIEQLPPPARLTPAVALPQPAAVARPALPAAAPVARAPPPGPPVPPAPPVPVQPRLQGGGWRLHPQADHYNCDLRGPTWPAQEEGLAHIRAIATAAAHQSNAVAFNTIGCIKHHADPIKRVKDGWAQKRVYEGIFVRDSNVPAGWLFLPDMNSPQDGNIEQYDYENAFHAAKVANALPTRVVAFSSHGWMKSRLPNSNIRLDADMPRMGGLRGLFVRI